MKPILLVEDNADDAFFMKRSLRSATLQNPLVVIEDGESALSYLKEAVVDNDHQYPLPGLVFLDVNLPGKSGFEILQWIREQPQLEKLAVVVLTSSEQAMDNEKALQEGASGVLIKPPTAAKLAKVRDDLRLSPEEFAQST